MAEEKKGILDRLAGSRLGSLLVEVKEEKPSKSSEPVFSAARTRLAQQDLASEPSAEVDKDAYDTLYEEVVIAESTPLTALLAQLEQLKDVIPDEKTLYAAAAKTSGHSIPEVLGAFEQHFKVLEREQSEFDQETSRLSSQSIDFRKTKRAELQAKIDEIDGQVTELRGRQQNFRRDFDLLGEEIKTEENRIDNARKVFGRAVQALKTELSDRRDKITQYLKGA